MGRNDNAPSIVLPLTISIIVISFAAIFVKWSSAPPTILGMYRMYIACMLLLPVVWMKRAEFWKISGKHWLLLLFSGVFLGTHFALWFKSLELTTVASSTIILALQPVVALAGVFLVYKERTTLSTILIISIAFIGVVLVGWGDIGISRNAIIGDLLSFLCVVAVVCYLLIGQNAVKMISNWVYSFTVFLFAGLSLTLFNLIAGIAMTGYPAKEWGIFLLLAIFPTVAHLIYNWLLNYVDSTTISMSILGEPVGATILAAILLGERVTGWQLFGGLLVLAGVFVFLMRQRKSLTASR
jgi:drug/metabolite transporter (DMT)-like permease